MNRIFDMLVIGQIMKGYFKSRKDKKTDKILVEMFNKGDCE